MRKIGYSSGAVAKGDFREALSLLAAISCPVVELSALRIGELEPLIAALEHLDLTGFEQVTFHAPSRFTEEDEDRVVSLLEKVASRDWPIVVHPGVLFRSDRWRAFGKLLLVENMDRRAEEGRTCEELEPLFALYPEAGFCLDLGHVRQIDPSMVEAYRMLRQLGSRLREVHLSDVGEDSRHGRISFGAQIAFRSIAGLIPETVPVVIESVLDCPEEQMAEELAAACEALTPEHSGAAAAE